MAERPFLGVVVVAAALAVNPATAQELTPRAYWPAPRGAQALIAAYAYQSGDVVTDASLPVTGADSRINSGIAAYQRTLSLFGRTSNLRFELPYASGTTRGQVEGLAARRDVHGFGDFAATLSINLLGAPSMSREEFQAFRADPQPILAASIKFVAPTGQYDTDRLINIGSNRWATRLRIGYILPFRDRWFLELSAGSWFFQDNDEFLGTTRKQKPITAFDASLIRRVRAGFWVSLDGNYYIGGRTTVDGVGSADYQRNSRLGLSVAYPVRRRHVLKASYSSGIATESGGDYDSMSLTYIYLMR